MQTDNDDRANDMLEAVSNQRNAYANDAVLLHAQVKDLTRKLAAEQKRCGELEARLKELEPKAEGDAKSNGHAEQPVA